MWQLVKWLSQTASFLPFWASSLLHLAQADVTYYFVERRVLAFLPKPSHLYFIHSKTEAVTNYAFCDEVSLHSWWIVPNGKLNAASLQGHSSWAACRVKIWYRSPRAVSDPRHQSRSHPPYWRKHRLRGSIDFNLWCRSCWRIGAQAEGSASLLEVLSLKPDLRSLRNQTLPHVSLFWGHPQSSVLIKWWSQTGQCTLKKRALCRLTIYPCLITSQLRN